MTFEKVIKDERGTLKIKVSIWVGYNDWEKDAKGNDFRYDLYVGHIPIGKRKEVFNNNVELLTEQEILEVKTELWNKLKP